MWRRLIIIRTLLCMFTPVQLPVSAFISGRNYSRRQQNVPWDAHNNQTMLSKRSLVWISKLSLNLFYSSFILPLPPSLSPSLENLIVEERSGPSSSRRLTRCCRLWSRSDKLWDSDLFIPTDKKRKMERAITTDQRFGTSLFGEWINISEWGTK